nr:hypothetical protein [Phenylobacterium sp. CCH12-B4]
MPRSFIWPTSRAVTGLSAPMKGLGSMGVRDWYVSGVPSAWWAREQAWDMTSGRAAITSAGVAG